MDEYIILSVEPSNWDSLPDSIQNGATVQDTFFVDYVRVYKKITTDVESNDLDIPSSFVLNQNYPNPFNPSTTIKYFIPAVGNENFRSVQLKVYDILGKEIATLVNKEQQSGNYEVNFNASNLPSGMYLYKIQAGEFSNTKKMLLLK
ncbi:MAG: T9SS type A sorting domain-containing protein [Chlorobi bacterium]|nr:T9SS type A sorting domain-containing protein [Chlorobiota bacterium]